MKKFAITLLASCYVPGLFAAERTLDLSIPTMNCPVCPITVRKALLKVAGVSKVAVDFDSQRATVTFDDAVTHPEQLTDATSNAGYPSNLADDTR